METRTRLKVRRLLSRVIRLQEKAPKDIHYNFEYSGHTNEVNFTKMRKVDGTYKLEKRICCYLEASYGMPLEEFENQIAFEEEVCENARV